ncbi:MAG: 4Fe-4S dicluster domain-containing protein [Candidatus Latescibacteria bacterium]|nr:4Fe-4S dicluster domain-containing protein [Candidatus Latescibacterota bacterium]
MNSDRKIAFLSDDNFEKLLDVLGRKGDVYIPQAFENRTGGLDYPYERRSEGKTFVYAGYRPSQPLKTFMFSGRMKVAEYPAPESARSESSEKFQVIAGVAACDLISLKSLDAVFLQDEFTDIFYKDKRDNTVLITADCSEPRETCFCTLAGNAPYPKNGFDLNLSRIASGFIIEAGSGRAEEIMNQNAQLFSPVKMEQLSARDNNRAETTRKVEEINKDYGLSKNRHKLLEIQRECDEWYSHVRTCIECGACLFSCPTCHCFLLYDQEGDSAEFQRVKEWDACVYAGYSKMAGGGSPRFGLMERFRHRYLHKFEYYPKNFGFEACTGCGRCVEGCMGNIDMRKVFKALDQITVGVR